MPFQRIRAADNKAHLAVEDYAMTLSLMTVASIAMNISRDILRDHFSLQSLQTTRCVCDVRRVGWGVDGVIFKGQNVNLPVRWKIFSTYDTCN